MVWNIGLMGPKLGSCKGAFISQLSLNEQPFGTSLGVYTIN